jgi:hypothetical protein
VLDAELGARAHAPRREAKLAAAGRVPRRLVGEREERAPEQRVVAARLHVAPGIDE